jgi:hypothetical protein
MNSAAGEIAMSRNLAWQLCALLLCIAETAVAGEPTTLNSRQIGSVQMAVKERLRDPDAARFDHLRAVTAKDGSLLVCGLVNVKNSSGGYTGFYPFMVGKVAPTIATSEVSAMLVLAACRAVDIELEH